MILGILDEAAFHAEIQRSTQAYPTTETSESYSGAVELYYALQERAQSRFGQKWLLFVVSSPLFVGDLLCDRLRAHAEGAKGTFAQHLPQWA